ncbi:MAG: glycosyltransferase [Chitinophagaceae bacterium]
MTDRIPQTPPVIKRLDNEEGRPLWSVMIPTYNCIRYLRNTIESVLLQDQGPDKMQIEVVDDFSTDGDVAAIVAEYGKGRVGFFQQEQNRGSLRNFETCLNRSKGKWVHLLHGDDAVKPGFYQEIKYLFNNFPEAGAAFTKYVHIDDMNVELEPGKDKILEEPGIIENFLLTIATGQKLQPPAIVVKRSVYEKLGGFFAVHYGEDWEMWIRIAANFPVAYSPKCLALYRAGHATNITSRSLSSGQNIKDINRVIDIVQDYLPAERKEEIRKNAKRSFSIHYARSSTAIYPLDKKVAFVQARGALRMQLNLQSFYWVVRLYMMHIASLVGYRHRKS